MNRKRYSLVVVTIATIALVAVVALIDTPLETEESPNVAPTDTTISNSPTNSVSEPIASAEYRQIDDVEANQIPELIRSLETLSSDERETAQSLAEFEAARLSADTYLRWEPVLVEDLYAFVNVTASDEGVTYTPKEQIKITPFTGTTVVVENTRFREGDYALSWTGEITSGGTGQASIRLLTIRENEQYVAIDIFSDVGVFRIEGIEGTPYSVVMELNPHKVEPPMM